MTGFIVSGLLYGLHWWQERIIAKSEAEAIAKAETYHIEYPVIGRPY
jgi:uncharacterized protein involved in tolerance to divalent cations